MKPDLEPQIILELEDDVEESVDQPTVPGAHVARRTGDVEWFTPKLFADAAREVMGSIDLDPASRAEANQVIRAARFYTEDEDGLDLRNPWRGRVWMNPPFRSRLLKAFCARLLLEIDEWNVQEACVLINNASETQSFQAFAPRAAAISLPLRRISFWHPDKPEGGTALQGQAILYFGPDPEKFIRVFSQFGLIVLPAITPTCPEA